MASKTETDDTHEEMLKEFIVRKIAKRLNANTSVQSFLERLEIRLDNNLTDIWNTMLQSTSRKIVYLLGVNDAVPQKNISMKMTANEWLLYDLVIVHGKSITANNHCLVPQCFNELFRLTQCHNIERLTGTRLAEAWIRLTLEYNKSGRMVSPMLLQRRWYKLKLMTRNLVYRQRKELTATEIKFLKMIGVRNQKIITHPFPSWRLLIKQKRVILPAVFIEVIYGKNYLNLEKPELWYLEKDNEFHESLSYRFGINNCSLTILSDSDIDDESRENSRNPPRVDLPKDQRDNEPLERMIPEENEENLVAIPKPIDFPNDQRDNEPLDQVISKEKEKNLVGIPKPIDLPKDQRDNDPLKQVASKEKEQHIVDIPKPMSINKDKSSVLGIDDDNTLKEKSEIISGLSKTTTDDIEDTVNKNTTFERMSMREVAKKVNLKRKSDATSALFNKDIELTDVNKKKKQKQKSPSITARLRDDNDMKKNCIENGKFKMKAIVLTRKIDTMEVFKQVAYDVVKDKKVIECALLESKPIFEHVSKDRHDGKAQEMTTSDSNMRNIHVEDDMVQDPKVRINKQLKSTSCLLRKPKRRSYDEGQLRRNPDFNIELKKLTPAFISSTSNKILLEKCLPLTVDVHKDVETNLVNGRITVTNLKKFKSANATKKGCNKHDPQKDGNLSNVEQIRKVNQSLLTPEMTPIRNDLLIKPSEITQPTVVPSTGVSASSSSSIGRA